MEIRNLAVSMMELPLCSGNGTRVITSSGKSLQILVDTYVLEAISCVLLKMQIRRVVVQ